MTGTGAGAINLENGASHSLAVTVDRIPPDSSKIVLIRFTPLGPAHSVYKLQASTVSDYITDSTIDGTDPAARLTKNTSSQSATDESGVLHMAGGAANVDISYALAFSPGAAKRDPAVTRTAGGIPVPRLAARSPARRRRHASTQPGATNGELTLTLTGPLDALKSVRDGTGNNAMTAQRKWIADCLLARTYIDQAQHDTLNELAEGGQTIEAVDIGLDEAAADALLSGQFETFAALILGAWETQLTVYLKEAAKKDPTNPFFKGKTEAEINGAVFEICRREDPPPIPPDPDGPPPEDVPQPPPPPPPPHRRRHPRRRSTSRSSTPRTRTTRSAPRAPAPGTSSPRAGRCPTWCCSRTSRTRAPLPTRCGSPTSSTRRSTTWTRWSSVRCSSATTR